MMSKFDYIDQETIEGQILYLIDRVCKGIKLHSDLTEKLESNRSRLRNLIYIYRGHRSEAEIDDLIAAIIKDEVLTNEEIQFAFDLNPTRWKECLHRIQTERK